MTNFSKVNLLIVVFLSFTASLIANEKDIQISLNLGVGLGVNGEIEYLPAITGLLNANVSFDKLLFSVRNHRMIEFPQVFSSMGFSEYARDVAIMVGYRDRSESSYIDLSVGIAHNSGLTRGELVKGKPSFGFDLSNNDYFKKDYYSNFGIAFEASLFQATTDKRGWGLTVFGNLNERNHFVGLTLTMSIFYRNKK